MSNSSTHPKFVVRMPDDLRDQVSAAADQADCSMNTVLVSAIREFLHGQQRKAVLLDALEQRLSLVDTTYANQIAREGENVNQADQFNLDEHVKLVADANRYRWLRDRECIEDVDSDLLVLRGETYFTGAELDAEVDTALRLQRLESREEESCAS